MLLRRRATGGGRWGSAIWRRRLWLSLGVVGLLGFSSLTVSTAKAAVAVAGTDQTVVELPPELPVEPYENHGYRLERLPDGRMKVTVDAEAMGSRALFTSADGEELATQQGDDIGRIARSLTSGARSHYQATARVLGWVSRNIEYRLDRQESQEAPQVLARRSAYCTGVARLSVALLRSVGIQAREVPGLVVSEDGAFYHRWVEIEYPGRGWAFSDPLSYHHYVPATYVPLARTMVPESAPSSALLVDRVLALGIVDTYPYGAPSVLARRNATLQRAAALRVRAHALQTTRRVPGTIEPIAEVEGVGSRHRLPLGATGEATFVGLDAGQYRLSVRWPSGELRMVDVVLQPAQRRLVELVPRSPTVSALVGAARHPLRLDHLVLGAPLTPPPFPFLGSPSAAENPIQ